jgi:putative FmdB family regulatory protein
VPTYQYHCKDCDADLEIFQKMTDPTLTVCPTCQGDLRKVFSAVGVVFKGSGFYATDNRGKSAVSPAASPADKGSEPKAVEAKPDQKAVGPAKAKPEITSTKTESHALAA